MSFTLVAGFYAIENWRGRRAWDRYAGERQALGQPLRLSELVPSPVPDEQNFVATPYWAGLRYDNAQPYTAQPDTNRWPEDVSKALREMKRMRARAGKGGRSHHGFDLIDLPALELAFREAGQSETVPNPDLPSPFDAEARRQSAQTILQFLGAYESVFEELRQASDRPKARFPIRYDTDDPLQILVPHQRVLKATCQALRIKATAELAAGNSVQAWEDVRLMFRLTDAVIDEPILISYLVHLACFQVTVSTIWEGMLFHSWTGSQLEDLQGILQKYEFMELTDRALEGERAFGNTLMDYLLRAKRRGARSAVLFEGVESFSDPDNLPGRTPFSLMPRGWIYLEKVNYNRLFDSFIKLDLSSEGSRINPALLDAQDAELDKVLTEVGVGTAFLKHQLFSTLLLPAITKVKHRGVRSQAFSEMGVLACALERYRLSGGSYPAALTDLVPRFVAVIPNDVVSDQPYHYDRKSDDAFVLYSVGWDQTDDGGTEERFPEGDWVWRDLVP